MTKSIFFVPLPVTVLESGMKANIPFVVVIVVVIIIRIIKICLPPLDEDLLFLYSLNFFFEMFKYTVS